jgi:hypothetical protein
VDPALDPGSSSSILRFVPAANRTFIRERLRVWQAAYMRGVSEHTELGQWLQSRPIVTFAGDSLFVHGGISAEQLAASKISSLAQLQQMNAAFSGARPEELHAVSARAEGHPSVEHAVTYRGMHPPGVGERPERGGPPPCRDVDELLRRLPEVKRIVVGHTAQWDVRETCGGRLVAADSSLGRWYHTYGNLYCAGTTAAEQLGSTPCHMKIDDQCRGEIVRMVVPAPTDTAADGGDAAAAGGGDAAAAAAAAKEAEAMDTADGSDATVDSQWELSKQRIVSDSLFHPVANADAEAEDKRSRAARREWRREAGARKAAAAERSAKAAKEQAAKAAKTAAKLAELKAKAVADWELALASEQTEVEYGEGTMGFSFTVRSFGGPQVLTVTPGGQSERQGVQRGDRLMSVAGRSMVGLDKKQALEWIAAKRAEEPEAPALRMVFSGTTAKAPPKAEAAEPVAVAKEQKPPPPPPPLEEQQQQQQQQPQEQQGEQQGEQMSQKWETPVGRAELAAWVSGDSTWVSLGQAAAAAVVLAVMTRGGGGGGDKAKQE